MVTTEYLEQNHCHQGCWIITSCTDDLPSTHSPVPPGFRLNRDDADATNSDGRAGNFHTACRFWSTGPKMYGLSGPTISPDQPVPEAHFWPVAGSD